MDTFLEVQLTPNEARLLGVLIEKSLTTSDHGLLTLNAATVGANQKTNREPVLTLDENEVQSALDSLVGKHLARRVFPENSRVEKYSHRAGEMLGLPAPSLAVLAELLLRGPQTPGELRTRASRMSRVDSLDELMSAIQPLSERHYAKRLPPAPGSRAERYAQTMCPDLHPVDAGPSTPTDTDAALADRVAALESTVEHLRRQLESLAARLGQSLDAPGADSPATDTKD